MAANRDYLIVVFQFYMRQYVGMIFSNIFIAWGIKMNIRNTLQSVLIGAILTAITISNAWSLDKPNANYSSLVLSFQTTKFETPVCLSNECHTGVSGPVGVFTQQLIPNFALGVSGSYLQSKGIASSITSTGTSVFMEGIAGVGPTLDVGVVVAALNTSLEYCSTNPDSCTTTRDTGTDLGVFGTVFLGKEKAFSIGLSYDAISYRQSANQSIIGLSFVAVLAKHHRLALSTYQTRNASGNAVSAGYGLGYSYLVF
jgi:hypothetical protein